MKLELLINLNSKIKRLPVRFVQFAISFFLPSKINFGVFRGTPLIKNWVGSSMLPKLLGTYEKEVAFQIYSILHSNIDVVVDIGCAGGYYLSIAAHLNKEIDLIGIDSSKKAEHEIAKYNKRYNTKINFINKFAEISDLIFYTKIYSHPFFIIDIEGFEFDLFRDINNTIPFSNSIFFIEVHKFFENAYEIRDIFFKTHDSTLIKFANYGFDNNLNLFNFFKLILRHELRSPKTEYLILTPKDKFFLKDF